MESEHLLAFIHHLLPFGLLGDDELEELLRVTFRLPAVVELVDGVIEDFRQGAGMVGFQLSGVLGIVDGEFRKGRLGVIVALAEKLRAVQRIGLPEIIEDILPGLDEVIDQLRVYLLGGSDGVTVPVLQDGVRYDVLVHVRIALVGVSPHVATDKLVDEIHGRDLVPAVRWLAEIRHDIGEVGITGRTIEVVLNLLLGLRELIQRTVFILHDRPADFGLQPVDGSRNLTGLDVGG